MSGRALWPLILAVALMGGAIGRAAIQEYEGFEYSSTVLDTQNGGTGWGGVWTNTDAHAVLSDDGTSLTFPSSVGHVPAGGRLVFDSTAGGKAERRVGTTLPLNVEGATYYVSALVKRQGGFKFEFIDNGPNVRWRFGALGEGDTNTAVTGVAGDVMVNNVFPLNETVLMVAKMLSRSNSTAADLTYLNVYRAGDVVPVSEPVNWQTSSGTGSGSSSGVVLTRLQIRNISSLPLEVDEIRIGTNYLEVVGAVAVGPPIVTLQPVGTTVYEGLSAQFYVEAGGELPLFFQWNKNGTPIDGATSATLGLNNLQLSDAASYTVTVSNAVGTAVSAPAVLQVTAITDPTVGLQGMWHFDETTGLVAEDASPNNNDGALINFAGNDSQWVPSDYTRALSFSSNYVEVAHSATIGANLVNRFSAAAWVNSRITLSTNGNTYRVMEKENSFFLLQGDGNTNNLGIGGMNVLVKKNGANIPAAIGEALLANQWYHIAATYDGSSLKMYLNGQLKDTRAVAVPLDSSTLPLHIGSDYMAATNGTKYLNGMMDEVGIWDRALSATEVLQLSGQTGVPTILANPESQSRYAGSTVTFQVRARGQAPLRYLWFKGETEIRTATTPVLTLYNIQPGDAGDYRCRVSNDLGDTFSAPGTLSITPVTGINDGLQALWKFDETTGMIAADSSGQTHDGQLTDFPEGNAQWTAGQVNGALSFDGVSNRVVSASPGQMDLGTDATFAFWINPTSYGSSVFAGTYNLHSGRVLRKPGYFDIEVVDDPGSVRATLRANGVPAPQQNILQLNQWQHFAVVYSGGMVSFYKNGFRIGDPVPGNLGAVNTNYVVLGNYTDTMSSTNLFAGAMDEVGVWARPLSETEILTLAGRDLAGGPVIVAQPQSASRYVGNSVSFFVNATGKRPVTYQWQHNGTPIPNSDTNMLVLTNLAVTDAGNYTVSVQNELGTVNSSPAALTIMQIDDIATGLIAYWKFDETQGTVFSDASGRGHHANLRNGTAITTAGLIGGGYSFDGVDDFAVVPNAPDLNLDGQATISVWVNPFTMAYIGDRGRIVRKDINFDFTLYSTGSRFMIYGQNKAEYLAPVNSVTTNQWQHLVVVVKDGTVQFFKNGRATGNPINGVLGPAVTNDVIIGNFGPDLSINRLFKGVMDDLGIWERALTAEEIDGIYQNGLVGRALNEPFIPFKIQQITFPSATQVRLVFDSPYTDRQHSIERIDDISTGTWVAESSVTFNTLGAGRIEALFDKPTGNAFYRVSLVSQTDVFSENFENGTTGWTHGGGGDNWELGTPVNGPGAAVSGTNVYATSLTGNILPYSDNWLRSPAIDLAGLSRATLTFQQWRNVDPDPTFHGTIVNILDASNLAVLQQLSLAAGATSGYQLTSLPLPPQILGKRVIIEFRLYCDNYNLLEGWYIDDVKIIRE